MKLQYLGSLARLQKIVQDCGVFGDWNPLEPVGGHQFRSTSGEIMNWWPSTGTVAFQGRPSPLQPRFVTVFVRAAANDDGVRLVNPRALIG